MTANFRFRRHRSSIFSWLQNARRCCSSSLFGLIQPLILAHVSGTRTVGVILPPGTARPQAIMMKVQALVRGLFGCAKIYSFRFLVAEYIGDCRLFTAPVDFAPPPALICRTAEDRRRQGRIGAAFLRGAPSQR